MAAAKEPMIPQFAHNLEVFKTKELTVPELLRHNTQQALYKVAFQQAWDEQQVDCILCPSAPMAGVPHDFPVWWVSIAPLSIFVKTETKADKSQGYTTIWNLLYENNDLIVTRG
jgi:hypothetical protein